MSIDFFPKCPFYTITGYKCPICGSQRAVHHLLNLELFSAAKENLLLIVLLPYIFFRIYLVFSKEKKQWQLNARKLLYGREAFFIALFIVIAFWAVRNLTVLF